MPEKVGAIITGGDFQALGVLRTLARKDIPIIMLDSDHCIGKYSKYKKKFFRSPRPSNDQSYVDFLIDLAKKERIWSDASSVMRLCVSAPCNGHIVITRRCTSPGCFFSPPPSFSWALGLACAPMPSGFRLSLPLSCSSPRASSHWRG